MRSFTAFLLWIVTTVALAAAVPATWAQRTIVDRQGYTALSRQAAGNRDLQAATAAELAAQIRRLGYGADDTVVNRIALAYTASPNFPGQFAEANGYAHRWLFTTEIEPGVDARGRWYIDLAPMLDDDAFAQTLRAYNLTVPDSLPIPLADNTPTLLRPGSLQKVARWGPWVSAGLGGLAAMAALLMLIVVRRRGGALVALGVSGLLVGASGWAAIEFGRKYLTDALNHTSGDARRIAEIMVATVEDSAHRWLGITLAAGAAVVVLGVIVSAVAGLIRGKASGAAGRRGTS